MGTKLKNLIIKTIIPVVVAILASAGVSIAITQNEKGNSVVEATFSIELAKAEVIETDDGEIEVIGAQTVEAVDSQNATLLTECDENEEECGLGRYYYAPVDTPYAFYDFTKDNCWDTDGAYGGQCWDYGDLFWQNYAGRRLSTCGSGAAKGTIVDGCWQTNAGNDFTMIWDPTQLQPGDWVVFNNGTWGHIGMALGTYNNGYISLAGQNQGGADCDGGGGAVNVINISLKNFAGAFRPNAYIAPEPEPEPVIPVSNCALWHVQRGDTMSKIMLECENTVVYGEAMNAYARTWYSLIVKPGQSVYDGWVSKSGVGLYAGDDIEHRIGE